MVPRLRAKEESPPVYDADAEEFTIEAHHGGIFVGYGHLRTYVGGKVDWFDHVESDTWSTLWFEDFLKLLGYDQCEKTKFYWLLPGRTLEDGLRVIVGDSDILVMAQVAAKVKNLVVYFDHEDSVGGVNWDDIVANPVSPLPKVISPRKVEVVPKKIGEKLPVFYTDLKKGRVEQNEEMRNDPDLYTSDNDEGDFWDSDNEIEQGDPDLDTSDIDAKLADQVEAKSNKKAKGCQLKTYQVNRPSGTNVDDKIDEEWLQLPESESDGEGERMGAFQSFVEEDMENPSFYVGLAFPSVEKLRQVVTEYSIRNRVEIKVPRNDRTRFLYPIAMAVVEVESLATWKWFLQTLKDDLRIDNTYPWTIMTDKQKGLIPAVQQVFSQSEHRFCVRHLYSNFQEKFKGENLKEQLWACARSSSVEQWNRNMERMKVLNPGAHEWLEKMPPNTWVRAFFSEFPKCDILLNNNCEVFNKYILDAREMPILSMFERIKSQLMARHFNKAKELADEMLGSVCPKIRSKLNKAAEYANICYALPSGQGVFQVLVKEYQHIVDIKAQTCDCRRWQLTGIPCSHAISCLRNERIPPESVLPRCYSVEAYNCAYGNSIWPCRDKREWEHVQGLEILPPIYEKKPGRPPKSRRKQPHEVQGKHGPKLSKHGVVIHCKHCGEANHNSKGCKLKKMNFTSEDAKKLVANTQAILQEEARQAAASATATTANPPNDEPLNQEFNVSEGTSRLGEGANQFAEESGPSMVTQMLAQESQCSSLSHPVGPLPDCSFIISNELLQRPVPLTTATKVGKKASAAKKKKEPAASKNGNKKAKTGSLTKN